MTDPLVRIDEVMAWCPSALADEAMLDRIAAMATGIVLDYVGPDPLTGAARTWTEATVPDPVRAAILHVSAGLWAHRGDASPATYLDGALAGQLPPDATRLLQRFRDPVIA